MKLKKHIKIIGLTKRKKLVPDNWNMSVSWSFENLLNVMIIAINELIGIINMSHKGVGNTEIYKKSKSDAPFSITKSICLNDWTNQIIEKSIIVILTVAMKTCLDI